ncbi:unnamed protein product [Rodentolepis nana]|uniref:Nudix hydrolase domain-containing protein n=1 Tax=Rodentolepis nana TaxID=102285 RepID=A0A0R3TVL2_RODNA|nr:unnamed protein product [Rodentolepis nana]
MGNEIRRLHEAQPFHTHCRWHFPGGKMESDESHVNCLIRELKEELSFNMSSYIREDLCVSIPHVSRDVCVYFVEAASAQVAFKPTTRYGIKELNDLRKVIECDWDISHILQWSSTYEQKFCDAVMPRWVVFSTTDSSRSTLKPAVYRKLNSHDSYPGPISILH